MGLRWIGVGVSCSGLKWLQMGCMGLVKLKWIGIGVELELRWSWSGVELKLSRGGLEVEWIGVHWSVLRWVEVDWHGVGVD